MPAYDSNLFNPPASLANVTLRNPSDGQTVSAVPMLLDSGADVTLIPQSSVDQLGLTAALNEGYELMGFDGSTSVAQVVMLDLIFLRRISRGRFLLINQTQGILGRDVLNHVSVLLDGPSLNWNEQKTSLP